MRPSELTNGMNRFFGGLDTQSGLPGWGRLRWSMSYDDARTNYPQAREANGALVLESQDPEPRHYQITMSFNASRQLAAVTLSFGGSSETADFAELSQAITSRLGAPVETTATSNTWRSGRSEVTLSQSPGGGVVLSEMV